MTIKVYSASDELTGAGDNARKVGRFELTVAARFNSLSKPIMRVIRYTVAGTTDAAVAAGGVTLAEKILALTQAKALRFVQVLGHYRQDEIVPVIASNIRSYGVIGHSPDPDDGLEALNLKLVIPWFDGSVADASALVGTFSAGGGTAALGNVRWTDQDETELEACYSELLRGVTISTMERVHNEPLSSANTADGTGDEYIGPDVP